MSTEYNDRFGHVPVKASIEFGGGRFEPVPNFDDVMAAVPTYTHPDGYVYPPIQHTMRQRATWKRPRKVKGSERQALLHNMPVTHSLTLASPGAETDAQRHGDGGFLVHFFGFLYGYRCQFAGWWMDGRYPVRSSADHSPLRVEQTRFCIDSALASFRSWSPRQRTVAINILYLYGRIWAYELEWERFQAAYQVADAIFGLAKRIGQVPATAGRPHGERIPSFSQHFGMALDVGRVETVVRLRNELLHEALWDGTMPGHAASSESFYASLWLEHWSRRAFFALCGLRGEYVRSPWWGLGSYFFDIGLPSASAGTTSRPA